MVFNHTELRSYLREVLVERVQANPAYSMRALAKNLSIPSSTLGDMLSGKTIPSDEKVMRMAERLQLKEKERQYLLCLVRYQRAKTPALKESLYRELENLNPRPSSVNLSIEHFRVISEWYHIAILECVGIYGEPFRIRDLAQNLGLHVEQVKEAIARLVKLELLEETPRQGYRKTENRFLTAASHPHEALHKFHRQMLENAIAALEKQGSEDRFTGSETFSTDAAGVEQIRQLSHRFLDEVAAIAKATKKPDRVCHVIHQMFHLVKKPKGTSL